MAKRAAKAPARKAPGRGRPTKLDPMFITQARKLALLGLTDEEMAGVFAVSVRTFLRWKKDHPDFCHAIAQGKAPADAEVAVGLFERARGYSHPEVVITSYQGEITQTKVTKHYPPDTQAASIWLRNRQPGRWKAQPDPTNGADEAPPPVKVVVQVKSARVRPDDAEPQRAAG